MPKIKRDKNYFEFDIGGFGVFFNKRYHLLSTINDLSLGLWFVIGSVLFLFHQTQTIGTIFFILGSVQLLGRPILKLLHGFFIRKESEKEQKDEYPSEVIEEMEENKEKA
ncbi:YrhK family protein [Salinicoccus sp. HZC-1]|uniref:YrhK family protein n=1 Tax=Salinicoccus sp. HZC-1 TaxID=3385497 RepID=UPI00398B74DE